MLAEGRPPTPLLLQGHHTPGHSADLGQWREAEGSPSRSFSQVIAIPPQCRASSWGGGGSGPYCLPPLGGLGEEGRARPVAKAVQGVLRYKSPSQGSLQSPQPLYPTLVRPEMKQGNLRPEFFSRRPFYPGNMKVPWSTLGQKLS